MIEMLRTLFPNTNLIWFEGEWCTERFANNRPVTVDNIVVHSLEIPCPAAAFSLGYDHKDKNYVTQGSCADVLKVWCDEQFGAHYIISSESIEKIISDLEKNFSDLERRASIGKYASYVHSPNDIALICCISPAYAAYHAGPSRFCKFGTFQLDKNRYTLNFSSIGIEIQGNGFYEKDKSDQNFDHFYPQQISMLSRLIKILAEEYTLNTITDVLTHSTIAPLRKKDPGRYFPFEALAKQGIGWILKEPSDHEAEKVPCVDRTRKLLMRIGYQLPESVEATNLQNTTDQEKQWGCVLPSSTPEVVWSTLDGFALQYAPWAWHTQPPQALCLSEAIRARVVKALDQHLESIIQEG